MESKYKELCDLSRQTTCLKSTLALLEWDQQTMLPAAGGSYRAEQITLLAGEIHRRETDPRRGELLLELSNSDFMADPHSDATATIRELDWKFRKKVKLSQSLVEAIARASSIGQQIWVEARRESNFQKFAPHLKEIFRLKREEADAIGFEDQPYDALLDEFEPGATTAEVAVVLNDLKNDLVPLIQQIEGSSIRPDVSFLSRNYPVDQQEKFCRWASAKIGFDYDRGRLDVTHHPFCSEMGPSDVRIATRYDESWFGTAFFGTLHEAGHGIYEQGLRSDQYGLPPGQYCSLGIHESQSRLWENRVGRSAGFWRYFFKPAQSHFGHSLSDVSEQEFHTAVNRVAPSLIRVEADEATYDLHIIIRFELEQEIVNGILDTDDLPQAWNSKYQTYLGICPESDANGVLQDVHWSAGLVGYFPTYSLGNLYASQFFDQANADISDLEQQFSKGNFTPLKNWLNTRIHVLGQCYRSRKLGKKVTGLPLSHVPLIRYLRKKLAPIYGL